MPWPLTMHRLAGGSLTVGGVAIEALAERFGTPLYVFDEEDLRSRARRFRNVFAAAYPASRVVYAAKAYLAPTLAALLWEEGVGLDVVSGGELYVGRAGGVPAAAMTFHGNNKSVAELEEALAAEIGLIAVDNDREIDLLAALTARTERRQPVLLRLNPGIEAKTHEKMLTGALDSKFGLPVATGAAESAVERVLTAPGLELVGYHAHVGSQIFDAGLVARTLEAIVDFAAAMRNRYGIVPSIVSPGGGFGVSDDPAGDDASIDVWAGSAAKALVASCHRHRLPAPELIVEPGRAMVGPAGVAIYRVGSRKEIPSIRTYVSVDGGMGDNIRTTLYGARYTAVLANRDPTGPVETVTIAGKYCESGDVLIEEIELPRLRTDDLLAVPMAGAYCLAMGSVYNLVPRPAVVLVKDGSASVIRQRETYRDLVTLDRPVRIAGWEDAVDRDDVEARLRPDGGA